jgi:simple sugar transport system ATP-binding protein
MMLPILSVQEVTKKFHQVVANDRVSFDVMAGEIHCLLGENGAGKSTIAECIYGFHRPDGGTISVRGKELDLRSPSDAIHSGIGMVHQHFVLVPTMTVLENIVIGTEAAKAILDMRSATDRILTICRRYDVDIDLNSRVSQLTVGQQQWVEILKALFLGAEILIMDEPTAVLTPQESRRLFRIFREMCGSGMSIILISHKLDEVMQSDRVTILRKGRKVATVITRESSKSELTNLMVGRDVDLGVRRERGTIAGSMIELHELHAKSDLGTPALNGMTLTVHSGEIVGIAGVAGNGQKELFETLMGVRHATAGAVVFDGKEITNLAPREVQKAGMGHIPDDRFAEGLVPDFDIQSNLVLGAQRDPAFSRLGFLRFGAIRQFARDAMEAFAIQAPSAQTACRTLSGGNAQKVIVAREFAQSTKAILANQPSRGLDIGVIEYMHNRLIEKRNQNYAILIASEELDELRALSDRIVVIFKGRIVGEFAHDAVDLEKIGLLMAGHVNEAAQEILTRNA